jgi:oligoendopeptidase F
MAAIPALLKEFDPMTKTVAKAAAPEDVEDPRLGMLPAWDLSDLYAAPDAPELSEDLAWCRDQAEAFHDRYEGKVAGLSGAELAAAVEAYEAIQERLSRLHSYADLVHAGDMSDAEAGQFYQSIQEATTEVSARLIFFTLALNRLEEAALEEKLADPKLARYRPWIRDLRVFRPHQLSDELERLILEKQVAGRAAWVRLFDETMAALRFPLEGKDLTSTEVLDKLSDPDPRRREAAARIFGKVLGENLRIFALVTNTLAKDKQIEDEWRGYARPISRRNLANCVEDEVVEALVTAVSDSFPRISHRYYALKAKWFGVEALPYWDRNAPLPEEEERAIPWSEARETVLGAYGDFSSALAEVGARFFDRPWIDVPPRPGKASGAFAHPTVPSAHPYLLLNYQGRLRDVMTLAHELGHGVHQVLAADQGLLLSDTPLTLAETASVFGEMLTFQALLAKEDDPKRRKILLAGKVEDMLNTVVRQIAFHRFETRVHDERGSGELLPSRLAEVWREVQSESLGPALRFEPEYDNYWAYIPHFVHSPFYVYAYAFGDCLVNALYAVHAGGHPRFAEKYLEMLAAGGTKRHRELLEPFGLDASDPAFWRRGLDVIAAMVDELETLA